MPSTLTKVPVGNPQTGYSVSGKDLVEVNLDGIDIIKPDDDLKTLISKVKLLKTTVGGSCYRLNVILQQLNARIAAAASSSTASATTSISTFIRVSSFFSTMKAGLETSHAYIPFDITGMTVKYTPQAININATTAPTGKVLIDYQVSTDDVTFNSILSSFVSLSAGNKFGATQKNFNGTTLNSGSWLRAIVAPGSDVTAVGLQVEMEVLAK
jgi:hypothetical protein